MWIGHRGQFFFYKGLNYEVLPDAKYPRNDVASMQRLSLPHTF